MAGLFGGAPKVVPEFTGLQVNTSVQVLPIPIIYGSPRVSINLIYYNGFTAKKVKQGGGKGLLSGGKGGSQIEYFATILLAVCEGQVGVPLIIYQDQNVWTPATFPVNAGSFWFDGSDAQAPLPYVVANWPQDARSYKDTAYYGFPNSQLDSSATVPQIDLVIQGLFQGTSPLYNYTITITAGQLDSKGNPISFIGPIPLGDADADPALVVYDFLTNERYGATFPSEFVDTETLFTSVGGFTSTRGDAALSTYCQAVGLAWSVVLNNAESANSRLERWMKNLNVAAVWDGAKLKFIPYWDRLASTNPGYDPGNSLGLGLKYFVPDVVPIVAIPIDQVLQSDSKDEDAITFSRKDPLEVYNTVRLDFKDRANFFNDVPAEAKDEVHIELYGERIDNIGLADEFSLDVYASMSVQMQLRRNISIMRTFTWKMNPFWGWLEPMHIVTIPDPANFANTIPVRITTIEDDEDENLTITAEEFPAGNQSPTVLPMSPTTPPNQGIVNNPPAPVFPPVMFAPTTDMLLAQGSATPQWIFGASGGINNTLDPNWGGVNIWISLDAVNYQLLGTLRGPSVVGTTTKLLPAYGGANPDNTDTLTVDLNESDGTLTSWSVDAAAAGTSIAVLQDASGFEVLSYTTATLVGPFTYALIGLYRGLYGTTPRAFGAGTRFHYVGSGGNFFTTSLPAAYVGMTFWVKPQSFNVFNTADQDLEDVKAYQYVATSPTPVGPTPPPSALAAGAGTRKRSVQGQSDIARRRK